MSRLLFAKDRELQEQELEHADAAHELRHRQQAAGLLAQLAMHGRQGRKDRGELSRHPARLLAGRPEEELVTGVRIADQVEQCFEAVHGAKLRAAPGHSE
jgi:hypothetical protein